MPLDPGTKLGAFEITGLLGKGGMGEVYRARDTKLGRDVAIKVLPEAIASDADYMARFEREAKVLASLDHPNIGAIYDMGRANLPVRRGNSEADSARQEPRPPNEVTVHFLVMQLVEGESLSERIRRGALSVREALPIFIQIARGLDAAHENGIVHRDLKPANVKLSAAGDAKVLDFGIAKDLTQADVDPTAPTTPMTSSPVTGEGLLVGTPHYMSPEQARGKPVDRRTDVWAFGCCLYEALTGDMPFTGETMTDIVTGIIHKNPDWSHLPDGLPRELERLVKRCLEKDLRRRPASMNDVAMILEDLQTDLREGRLDTARTRAASGGGEPAPIRSLVVLPFENLMGDSEQDYLVDGMTEALTAELSKIHALKVTSRSSAMQYRKSKKSMSQIAGELGVDGLVEGSIFRAGDGIRITAQLIDGRTDAHVWSENFTGTMDGMLQLQGDVALAIAKAIRVAVTPEEKKLLRAQRRPISQDVQRVLWEASYAFNLQSVQGYRDATRLYERATQMDPDCTIAYVGLAAAYWVPSTLGLERPSEALAKAEKAAQRALELEPESCESQYTAGYMALAYHHDREGARNHFERAIEISPSSADAHWGLALWHFTTLDFDAAVREAEASRELNPASPMYASGLGLIYAAVGRFEEADAQYAEALEMSPQYLAANDDRHFMRFLGAPTKENLNAFEEYVAEIGDVPHALGLLASAYGHLGQTAKAAAIARSLEERAASRYVSPAAIAYAFAGAGNHDKAAEYHAKAIEEHDWIILFLSAPFFHINDGFRADPRFEALLKQLNLPESARRKAIALRPRMPQPPSSAPPVRPRRRAIQFAALGVTAVVLLVAGFVIGAMRESDSAAVAPSDTPRIDSLAVLPLDNLMNDPEQDYFVDGMTEAVTAELSKISSLKVISRTSAMTYKNSDKRLPEIASELGVQGLIEGSVMREGDNVRITVQLVDGPQDRHVWAKSYTNTVTSVLKLQAQVALAIADAVRVEVEPEEHDRIANKGDVNPQALEAYLKGRALMRSREESDLRQALDHFQRAIELDSTYASAYSGIADAYNLLANYEFVLPSQGYSKAIEAAQRSIELDPYSAEAHASLGMPLLESRGDWKGARAEFEQSVSLGPNYPQGLEWYGLLLLFSGQNRQAHIMFERALGLDPRSRILRRALAAEAVNEGDFQRATRELEDLLEQYPDFTPALQSYCRVLSISGRNEQALLVAEKISQLRNADAASTDILAAALVRLGRRDEADSLFQSHPEQDTASWTEYYLALGDTDRFLAAARKKIQNGYYLSHLAAYPEYDPLRKDDRFWEFLEEHHYPKVPPGHPVYEQQQAYLTRKAAETLLENQPPVRYSIHPPPEAPLAGRGGREVVISRDGQTLVYVASTETGTSLVRRNLGSLEFETLRGTEAAYLPSLKRDGAEIACMLELPRRLVRYAVSSGIAKEVSSDVGTAAGIAWTDDGDLVYAPDFGTRGLTRVSASGDTSTEVTTLNPDGSEIAHAWPHVISGTDTVLFTAIPQEGLSHARIEAVSLSTGKRTRIIDNGACPVYVRTGHLLYGQLGRLMAVPFDVSTLKAIGDPVVVQEGIVTRMGGAADFDVSDNGVLVYVPAEAVGADNSGFSAAQPVWVSMDGAVSPLPMDPNVYRTQSLSPSGTQLATCIDAGGDSSLWIVDPNRGTTRRLSIKHPWVRFPVWSPDGSRLAFSVGSVVRSTLGFIDMNGDSKLEVPDVIGLQTARSGPTDWSRDGRTVIYTARPVGAAYPDVFAYDMESQTASPVVATDFTDDGGRLSPDGRWLAYHSDESGVDQVYVREFRERGPVIPVSVDRGSWPTWAPDGKTIYFLSPRAMMAVTVEDSDTMQLSRPKRLFELPFSAPENFPIYDIHPDGDRFLMMYRADRTDIGTRIVVVHNWFTELKRLAPRPESN